MPPLTLDAGFVLTAGGVLAAVVLWLSYVRNTANTARDGVIRIDAERKEDKVTWGRRLEHAEQMSGKIEALIVEIRAQGERHDMSQEFTKQQLSDIRQEMRHIRANASMTAETTSRRSRTAST